MKEHNPGIWIGATIFLAVLIVALSVPSKRPPSTPPDSLPNANALSSDAPGHSAPSPDAAPSLPGVPAASSKAEASQPVSSKPGTLPPRDPDDPVPPPPAEKVPATIENARQSIDDLQLGLRDYRNQLGGNPVGSNSEITSALLGNNLKQVKWSVPRGSTVNASGELCDLWGTPYFFHQLSGRQMEIRSAGPDREMWTGDDIRN